MDVIPYTSLLRLLLISCLMGSSYTDIALGQTQTDSSFYLRRESEGKSDKDRYHSHRERGWHWYESSPEAPAEVIEETPNIVNTPEEGPEPLSVEWLRVELEKARIEAIDSPTRENSEYYGYLQKLAMDKAERFAMLQTQVNLINPSLDETIQNPTSTFTRSVRADAQRKEQERVLGELASKVGIYYFFKSDCQYCAKQNEPLAKFANKHGFSVLPISIDGIGMQSPYFTEWVADSGQAAMLKVTSTPTLYLFKPPNELTILSVGMQAQPQLQKRILQTARANEWISEDDYEKALSGLPKDFLVDAIEEMDAVNWSNKEEALEAFRAASKYGVEKARMNGSSIEPVSSTPIKR